MGVIQPVATGCAERASAILAADGKAMVASASADAIAPITGAPCLGAIRFREPLALAIVERLLLQPEPL